MKGARQSEQLGGRRLPPSLVFVGSTVLLLGVLTVGGSAGPVSVPFGDVWSAVGHRIGLPVAGPANPLVETLVWRHRLPHYLMAALVGATLAVAGAASQAPVRNPTGHPYLLGASSGTAVGAVATILVLPGAPFVLVAAVAFAAGILTMVVVIALSMRAGQISPLRLILGGIALGQLLAGFISLGLLAIGQAQATGVSNWLEGSVATTSLGRLWLVAILLPIGAVILYWDAGRLNALAFGDETAASLGTNVTGLRLRLTVVTSLLTAAAVCLTGIIGFVGLVVPHVVRLLVGPDHRRLVPLVVPLGAAFLVVCDYLSRTLFGDEFTVPIGVVTGLFGGPLFLWLLRHQTLGGNV